MIGRTKIGARLFVRTVRLTDVVVSLCRCGRVDLVDVRNVCCVSLLPSLPHEEAATRLDEEWL